MLKVPRKHKAPKASARIAQLLMLLPPTLVGTASQHRPTLGARAMEGAGTEPEGAAKDLVGWAARAGAMEGCKAEQRNTSRCRTEMLRGELHH